MKLPQRLIAITGFLTFGILGTPAILLGNAIAAPDPSIKMVMVDQSLLSASQRNAFQQYIQTADLPRTKIGKRCQYYSKPDVWCLILDEPVANQVFQQLSRQPFGLAASVKSVRRLRGSSRS